MTNLTPEDLTALERTYLGVLSLGLVPADLARESRYRLERITAICHAMLQELPVETFLGEQADTANERICQEMRTAMIDLDRKGVIGAGPPQDLMILKPSPEAIDTAYGNLDINRPPPIFDRFLAQRCMELLMERDEIRRFLMVMYADSGEVWGDLYKQGYGQYR